MKNFKLTIKADSITRTVWTVAADKKSAIERVMSWEKCPRNAIKKVKEYPRIEWTRINNDVNGNPRYVCHFLTLLTDKDEFTTLDKRYELAVKRARKIGGRKYHTKSYGGGIVFQSYNIQDTEHAILDLLDTI